MSKEQITNFIEEIQTNNDLREKLRVEDVIDVAAFIKAANDAGFDFTAEEWDEYDKQVNEARNVKLADDDLDKVSGGGLFGDCPKKYDELLCSVSMCKNYNTKIRFTGPDGSMCFKIYKYCSKGYYDEEKGI